MNKSELQPLIDVLIPKLFSFAYALIPDQLQAEQIVIDAYSVFVLNEKENIETFVFNPKSKKERSKLLNSLFNSILSEIYKLAQKRVIQLKVTIESKQDLPDFYSTEFSQRAILFLKYKLHLKEEEIRSVLKIQRYQVIEKLYNAKYNLMNNEKEVRS